MPFVERAQAPWDRRVVEVKITEPQLASVFGDEAASLREQYVSETPQAVGCYKYLTRGYFLGFSYYGEDGEGIETYAMIECVNGKIIEVMAPNMQFIDSLIALQGLDKEILRYDRFPTISGGQVSSRKVQE